MRILLAIDGSPCSAPAVRAVATRPWPPGTVVRVVTVVEDVYPAATVSAFEAGLAIAPPEATEAQQALWNSGRALVEGVAQELEQSGLRTEVVERRGTPATTIVDEARDWGADLILVGSHGRTGLKRVLMGSVAERVVSRAPCSVEVVRRHEEQARAGVTPSG